MQVYQDLVLLQSPHVWIGLSAESALVITDAQGIDCMEDIKILTDGDI